MIRLWQLRTWPLRIRLVGVVALLGICLCAAVSTGTLMALRTYLVKQVDQQVVEAQSRSAMFYDMGKPPFVRFSGPGPMFLDGPGQSSGTIGAIRSGGTVGEAAVVTPSGNRQALSASAAAQLAKVPTGQTVSVNLDGVGTYRVTADAAEGKGVVLLTGLSMSGVEATLNSAGWIIGGFSLVALLGTVAAGMVIMRRELVPLSRMSRAAERVARMPLDRGEVRLPTPIEPVEPSTAHTEVGRLGTAFNMMIDRVAEGLTTRHATEMRVRRFVADASHELRTPLASIQGYTEFAQRLLKDAGEHVDADRGNDLSSALTRVRAESLRMGQLVEDMLLLARLDAGRPVEHEDVDLTELVIDAVRDAHVAGPDHRWALDLPGEPVTITGDRSRLHQALANLLSNARVHTPPGTKIVASLVRNDDRSVAMIVTDEGPGISKELLPNVFERFARGDDSRSRASGSTGLGLAITLAVIKAHDGTIDVTSSPRGTTFTVCLPQSPPLGTTASDETTRPVPIAHRPMTSLSSGSRGGTSPG